MTITPFIEVFPSHCKSSRGALNQASTCAQFLACLEAGSSYWAYLDFNLWHFVQHTFFFMKFFNSIKILFILTTEILDVLNLLSEKTTSLTSLSSWSHFQSSLWFCKEIFLFKITETENQRTQWFKEIKGQSTNMICQKKLLHTWTLQEENCKN